MLPEGILLDPTVFYPMGDGQPGDSGILTTSAGVQVKIIDTPKPVGPIPQIFSCVVCRPGERS